MNSATAQNTEYTIGGIKVVLLADTSEDRDAIRNFSIRIEGYRNTVDGPENALRTRIIDALSEHGAFSYGTDLDTIISSPANLEFTQSANRIINVGDARMILGDLQKRYPTPERFDAALTSEQRTLRGVGAFIERAERIFGIEAAANKTAEIIADFRAEAATRKAAAATVGA